MVSKGGRLIGRYRQALCQQALWRAGAQSAMEGIAYPETNQTPMKRFSIAAALALLPLAGCGDDGFLHGSAPVTVTDTSSAIEASGRFRCSSGMFQLVKNEEPEEPDHVVRVEGRLANTSGRRAPFVAALTIVTADQEVKVEREWVMPPGTSVYLNFGSRDQAISGRESLKQVVLGTSIERCDLTIR